MKIAAYFDPYGYLDKEPDEEYDEVFVLIKKLCPGKHIFEKIFCLLSSPTIRQTFTSST